MGEEVPTVSSPADYCGLLGAHSSEEDSFEGEGLEEVTVPTPDPPPEETLLTRLVDLCSRGEKEKEEGKVPLSRLMEVMETGRMTYTVQEMSVLSKVYEALASESKRNGLVNSKGDLEVIVDIRNSQVLRDLLNHYQQNGDQLDLWEPSLSTFLDTSKSPKSMPETVDNPSTNGVGCASSDSSSSAGILTSLELSLFSYGSREGIAGDFLETEDIEKEAEQLRHSNRKLTDEKAQLEKQVTLTDEMNQQLMHENKKLLGNVQGMQRQVEQLKKLTKEYEEMKSSLLQSETTARENLHRLQQTEANNNLLNKRLGVLSADLEQAQTQLEAAKQQEKEVSRLLAEQRQLQVACGVEKAHFEELYVQESAKFTKAQEVIKELHQVVEMLKQEKQDLEYQLYQSQQEVLQLKQLVGCQSVGAKKAEGEEGGPASDEGVFDEQCPTPPGFSATTVLPICHETSLTSSPLISSLNLQTPFRGRTSNHLWGGVSSSSWQNSLERRNLFNTLQQNGVHSIEESASSEELASFAEDHDFKVHELLQRLDDKEELIHDLRSKLERTQEEQASLSERMSRMQRCLSNVSKAISCSCCVIKEINAEAIRMLESQCDTSALFAQLKTENRVVNAFQEGFPEDIVSGQINLELQTLRAQIARSQAVLAYLQSRAPRVPARTPSDPTASRRVQTSRQGCFEEGSHPEDETYDVPYGIRKSTRRTFSRQQSNPEACPACGSDLTSPHSSPLRHHPRLFAARSCPALPACEVPTTRGTQTSTAAVLTRDSQTDVSELAHLPSVALETVTEVEVKEEELDSPLPRNRSNSFVRAIREGNPNLVDAEPYQTRVDCRAEVHREQTPEETMPAKSRSPNMPEVTVEDVDARPDSSLASTRRKSLSEVTRSAAIDLDHGEPIEEETIDDSQHKESSSDVADAVSIRDYRSQAQWKRARDQGGFGLRRPMPDLMEGSETESAKGSLEIEDGAFPSFSDTVLGSLGLGKDAAVSDQLTEQEIESKFASLSLGFKTDKLTLSKRLELHQRHRDVAEKNNVTELKAIWDLTNALNKICTDDKQREVISKIQSHLEVLQQSTDRISSRAEVYGAVQQEERMCKAFEVMVAHVENLKRSSEKERRELEEMRRLMLDHQLQTPQEGASCSSPGKDSRTRLFSIPSSGTSPALSRLVRAATTIRRCSLPVAAPAQAEDAHSLLQQALKNSAKGEEHASDETVPQGAKVGTQQDHKIGDCKETVADEQNSSAAADESSTVPEDSAVLPESTACDPEPEGEGLEQDCGEAEGRDELESSRSSLAPEDFWAQWATSLLTKLKHWLESSRRALIRKRRPYLSSEAFRNARYIISGFLVVAALFSLLVALLPSPTGAHCSARQPTLWELMDFSGPYVVELRWWSGPPPT
ncbi:uncharacterized protein LOC135401697 isoform X2 [Ornithodoros turicata]|uniref:uncharacterized protein LOC135401697 isoform X2 n=1 Tax=Ornithodoros turicata TaxID=34597 RepID=UPI003138C4BD